MEGDRANTKQLVQVPAQVVNMQPRVDGSWKLAFETPELPGEDVALLADSLRGQGWLLFRPNGQVTPDEVPAEDAETSAKTPSQRLHAVLYVFWEQRGKKGSFTNFYAAQMDKLIGHVKEQLT